MIDYIRGISLLDIDLWKWSVFFLRFRSDHIGAAETGRDGTGTSGPVRVGAGLGTTVRVVRTFNVGDVVSAACQFGNGRFGGRRFSISRIRGRQGDDRNFAPAVGSTAFGGFVVRHGIDVEVQSRST